METQNKKFTLQNVVIHFPHILEPAPVMGNENKLEYSCRIVMPENHPQLEEFVTAVHEMQTNLPSVPPEDRRLLKSYTEDSDKVDFERFPEYKNGIFFKAKTQFKPQLLNSEKQPANDYESQTWMWAGAICHVSVTLYSWSNKFGNGISCNLRNVMLTGQGNKIEGGNAANDFADIEPTKTSSASTEYNKESGQSLLDKIRNRTETAA